MSSYWRERQFSQRKLLLDKSIEETKNYLTTVYKSSIREVENDMRELYLDLLVESEDGKVKINDLYRYNRYWELRNDLNSKLQSLGEKEIKILDKALINQYYSVQEYFNKNPKFLARTEKGMIKMVNAMPVDLKSPIVSEKAQAVANSVWCADGKYWSERVWQHKEQLQAKLEQGLLDTITRGAKPEELSKVLKEDFNVSFNTAQTLVRTELTHVYVQAAADRYSEAGCEYYEVLSAQSDDECYDMNGAVIRLSEMIEGENCPPFHPNCRCTILPVIKGGNNG